MFTIKYGTKEVTKLRTRLFELLQNGLDVAVDLRNSAIVEMACS